MAARNRELSQFGSFVYVDNTTKNIGIATESTPYVGIGTDNPISKLDVGGDIHVSGIVSSTKLYLYSDVSFPSIETSGTLAILSPSVGIGTTISATRLTVNGNITATSFIKDDGSSGFLKADGTVDTSVYLTPGDLSENIGYWVKTSSGIHTTSNVGIGTTNPLSNLQVQRYGVSTGFGTFNATAGVSAEIDTFTVSSTDFKTAEYTLHFTNGNRFQSQKVLVMQNGTTAYSQEYAIMYEPNQIVSISSTITSGMCKLYAIPEVGISGITTYRIVREGLL